MFHFGLPDPMQFVLAAVLLCGAAGASWLAIEVASGSLMLYDVPQPPEPNIRQGTWQPGQRPWWHLDEPLAPLDVSLLVCALKTPDSPERVC